MQKEAPFARTASCVGARQTAGAVEGIADQGMSASGQMDADLVRPAGHNLHFDEARIRRAALENPHVAERAPAGGARPMDLEA